MKNLTFEVHMHAPELNKIFCSGKDITKMLAASVLLRLTPNYTHNVQTVRKAIQPRPTLKTWKLIATRPDGTIETRFCAQLTINGIFENLKEAKKHYNIEGTQLDFRPYFKY